MKKQLWLASLVLSLSFGAGVPAVAQDRPQREPDWDRSYKPPAPKQYKVDAKTLYGVGISVSYYTADGEIIPIGTNAIGPSFPNKCFTEDGGTELTLSDAFINHYSTRGFSLAAICLAVTSGGWVKYNVETGKPLRTANSYLIDIPNCFKNGAPLLECDYRFEHTFGLKATDAKRQKTRERARAVDQAIRALIADGKFSQACTCDDIAINKGKFFHRGKSWNVAGLRPKHGTYVPLPTDKEFACRSETVPACAQSWLPGRDMTGWPMLDVFQGAYFRGTPLQGLTDYGPFDISPRHVRGYAYRIGSPEGEDDRPFLELAPGTKLNVAE
jgi:hypothetical protein